MFGYRCLYGVAIIRRRESGNENLVTRHLKGIWIERRNELAVLVPAGETSVLCRSGPQSTRRSIGIVSGTDCGSGKGTFAAGLYSVFFLFIHFIDGLDVEIAGGLPALNLCSVLSPEYRFRNIDSNCFIRCK